MERLKAGFTETANPFNAGQIRRVSLLPEDVEVLVFWTRDPRPILVHAETLEEGGYRFYGMITLTGYPPILEPNVPPQEEVIAAMRKLAEKLGWRRLIWRYDPIFLCSLTDGEFHIRNFRTLVGALRGAVDRVVFSVYDPYPAAQGRIAALERSGAFKMLPLYEPVDNGGGNLPGLRGGGSPKVPAKLRPELRELLAKLARIAGEAGMTVYACAEAEDLSSLGIAAGACIDAGLIKELWGIEISGKDKNQRPHCRCAPSVDIGWYGPCPAACIYCYARKNTKTAAGGSAAGGDTPTCPQ
jgi:nucleotide-binding universal stress UspA family protein